MKIPLVNSRYNFCKRQAKITRTDTAERGNFQTTVISSEKMRLFSFFCRARLNIVRAGIDKWLVGFFIIISFNSSACQCPITTLSKAECNKYDIIFRGTVLSVATCDNKPGVAIFKVKDLYKGAITEQFKVIFSCDEECSYKMQEGEEWIIYSNFKQIDRAKLDWCSRSRRLIKNVKEDYYTATSGNTYDEETKFLQDSIGIHRLLKQQVSPEELKNKLPSPNQQIIILICSLACVILFYYLFNKFFK